MASLIPGYQYDIFISYRQKDNKYDGWVSEFVDNLKKEIEATFKEDVSVYFDINPFEGLLETHDVNASLQEKLKCLIFIPIISRTYCDPKSFAWEHEFRAFVEMASKDQYGLKVKLPDGNVASRVLPVRIHNLESADVSLCESVLGSALRGVDFIYSEPGVNRPLKPDDDEKINLNKTKYRNQINKISNAIRELVSGLNSRSSGTGQDRIKSNEKSDRSEPEKRRGHYKMPAISLLWLLLTAGLILAFIIVTGIVYNYLNNASQEKRRMSGTSGEKPTIAVIPFQNMTNDTIWNLWQRGIQDELVASLTNSGELSIVQAEPTLSLIKSQGLSADKSITLAAAYSVSAKLDASLFIWGNIKKAGPVLRITAQLIDTKSENSLKSFQIEGPDSEEKIFDLADSLSLRIKNYLLMSQIKKVASPFSESGLSTGSPEAYRYYINGNNASETGDSKTAQDWYLRAIAVDSNYVNAIVNLSINYSNQGMFDDAKKWCLKIYNDRDQMPERLKILVNRLYALYFETPEEQIKYLREIKELDDHDPNNYINLGIELFLNGQYEKSIPEFERSIEIFKKWETKPQINTYTRLLYSYYKAGDMNRFKRLIKRAEKDYPENTDLAAYQAFMSLIGGDTKAADKYIEKYRNLNRANTTSEADILNGVAAIYEEAGILDKAEEYYRQSLSVEPENPDRMNSLAAFLIDKDRNVTEGMRFVEKALELKPDDFFYLDTKGWGLYKQGRYKDAVDVLENAWNHKPMYWNSVFLHLELARKAVAALK